MAIVGLSIHSLFDGVAIGAAVGAGHDSGSPLALAVFLSVLVHKPMDGLSVSALLLNTGMERRTLWTVQVIYAALVPLGAGMFCGTFLAIALTDLLPELHFHSHDRNKLSAALLFGLAVMWATTLFEHGHGHDKAIVAPTDDHDHDHHHHEPH
jgi:zinc and cadmium transporter